MPDAHSMRATAREIFMHAVGDASSEKALAQHLQYARGVLRVCDDLYDLRSYSRALAVSFGKAGHRMAETLAHQAGTTIGGIVADPNVPPHQLAGYRYFTGGHPEPNQDSVRAADAILKALGGLDANSLVLFMISGGGSAVVEKLADQELTVDELLRTYARLVLSSAPLS